MSEMMPWKAIVLIVTVIFFVLIAWLGRYQLVSASTGNTPYAYRLDRWTGEVVFLIGGSKAGN